MKKIPQTDAIFEHVWRENQAADENPNSLRLSIDTKAKVKIGNLSRGGKARGEAKIADDHDTEWQALLVPFGILNTNNDQLSIYFGQSAETSDFIVDCLTDWWQQHQADYGDMNEWVIDLEGGSATRSDRTQFIKDHRYHQGKPTLFTTNKPLAQWGRVLHDEELARVIIDRTLHHGDYLKLSGPSYRLKGRNLTLIHLRLHQRLKLKKLKVLTKALTTLSLLLHK